MGQSSFINRIKELEEISSPLEPGAIYRSTLNRAAIEYAETYLESLAEDPAYKHPENDVSELYRFPVNEHPLPLKQVLKLLSKNVDSLGVNSPSQGNLAYIPGGALYHSTIGDYLAAVTNRYAGHFYGSPGAVHMENMLLGWMAELVGYPPQAAGNLTSGGSIAQLIAFVTAREAFGLLPQDFSRSVVYLTEQSHHSIEKGLHIVGLGKTLRRIIPTDKHYRMAVNELEEAIKSDKKAGLLPWLIVATAGTTNTGAVDPLPQIGSIAKRHDAWYHIDGAYGAFFILCDLGKSILQGMQDSDSLILDPHKGLFLPYGSGAVLVKEAQHLKDAFAFQASYTQDAAASPDVLSPSELSPELSKHSRGLRLWLPLMLLGTRPFAAALEEKILLAWYLHEQLGSIDGFAVGPLPDLSIVTFRCLPKSGDVNEFNKRLLHFIRDDGRIFLSSTNLDGNFVIRLAVLGLRTHLDTIEMAIDLLKYATERIQVE
jgi:glutamate/tyrosine decarboxylase-like PLP-dependent enzyme